MLLIGKWRDNLAPGAHEKVIAKSDDSDDSDDKKVIAKSDNSDDEDL